MKSCQYCGCRVYSNLCSNCDEAAYIMEFQGEFLDGPVSDSFVQEAEEGFERQKIRNKIDKENSDVDRG